MLIRKNRILQVLFTLLLITVIFPILFNIFINRPLSSSTIMDSLAPMFESRKVSAHPPVTDPLESPLANLPQSYLNQVSGKSPDSQLAYLIADLNNRVKHAEMISGQRRHEMFQLLREIRYLWSVINRANSSLSSQHDNQQTTPSEQQNIEESILQQAEQPNSTSVSDNEQVNPETVLSNWMMPNQHIHLPSLINLMPFVRLSAQSSFDPVFRLGSNVSRGSVRFVFGIPTVKRVVESYLMNTLDNLINNLTPEEQSQSCFVVFVAETDLDFVHKTADQISARFPKQIESGLIEVISPPKLFYPDLNTLKQTLDDTMERVRWRSKQNFDFAYLMLYCQTKGTYYIQLEDDIISKPSYLLKMEEFLAENALKKRDWLILDFCALGFIGKMFKSSDLSSFVLFFVMFYNDKPVDWLLINFVQTKMCRFDKDSKHCRKQIERVWIKHKNSLFQHIGTHSSLKGKIQKLRDKGFGKLKLFVPHLDNPPATVYSSLQPYQQYKLSSAYLGSNFFWSLSPVVGDVFGFKFFNPANLERCLIRTGNLEHPQDILFNATLQVKPFNSLNGTELNSNLTSDTFIDLASFNPITGLVNVTIPPKLNPIKEIRVFNEHNSTHWLIISEIHFKTIDLKTSSDIAANMSTKS